MTRARLALVESALIAANLVTYIPLVTRSMVVLIILLVQQMLQLAQSGSHQLLHAEMLLTNILSSNLITPFGLRGCVESADTSGVEYSTSI